jgi:hypothetical protein
VWRATVVAPGWLNWVAAAQVRSRARVLVRGRGRRVWLIFVSFGWRLELLADASSIADRSPVNKFDW